MAQPATAPQKVTVKIQNGVPDQDPVNINIGQEVEFHNEDNTPYEIPLGYLDSGSTVNYPLAAYLPAGGKFGLIGMSAATCTYNVHTVSAAGRPKGGPPYNIVVG